MAVNKVVFGNTTVMDITDSTVDSDSLLTGVKAYGADGDPVIGGVVKSWTGTAAQYAQEASQIPDGTQVNILDDFTPVGMPIGIANICSIEEREIGVWINGKPLYQKTIDLGNLPNATTAHVNTGISNVERLINYFATATDSNGGQISFPRLWIGGTGDIYIGFGANLSTINIATTSDRSGMTGYCTVQYTKTTDAPGSGKYVPSGAPAVHYSTDEQVIGTWINGKPLYQKTVSCGALPANTSTNTPHNVSNIDKIVGIRGVGIRTNESNYVSIPLPHAHYANVANQEEISVNKTNIIIRNGNSSANTFDTSYVTIEYTKTTD